MEIVEQVKERDVIDLDFMFVGGSKLTITLDEEAGDTLKDIGNCYLIEIAAKAGLTDEDAVEAETIKVFQTQLAMVASRKRKQRMPSEAEKLELQSFIHALGKQVQ